MGSTMGMFFNADKYITRVDSPRISRTIDRKSQVLGYLYKYFEMYNHDYLEDVCLACTDYIEDTMDEQYMPSNSVTSAEVQAATTIIKGLQGFVADGNLDELKYLRFLAAKEAFVMYCGMISKVYELEIIDRKQARRRISKFYKDCGLAS